MIDVASAFIKRSTVLPEKPPRCESCIYFNKKTLNEANVKKVNFSNSFQQ